MTLLTETGNLPVMYVFTQASSGYSMKSIQSINFISQSNNTNTMLYHKFWEEYLNSSVPQFFAMTGYFSWNLKG